MSTFFASKLDDSVLVLNEEESWHCAKVLRMKAGEEIEATDGRGLSWEAKLLTVNEKRTTAIISNECVARKKNYSFHLAFAPTKSTDRLEWMIEKSVELGVDSFTPLLCKNSERKNVNASRLVKIIESAVKQSKQSFLPVINEMQKFQEFIEQYKNFQGVKLIAHCFHENRIQLSELNSLQKDFIILIGPEGDFRKEEVSLAWSMGFQGISLGNSRLRTETAAIYTAGFLRSRFE